MGVAVDGQQGEEQIEQLGGPRQPERWVDDNLQLRLVGAPRAVVVGGPHTEGVGARGDVRIGSLVAVAAIHPVLVEAFEHVGILVFLGCTIAQGGKRQAEHVVAMREVELRQVGKALRQRLVAHGDGFVVDAQGSDEHCRRRSVDIDLIGEDGTEAPDASEIETAIGSLQHGVGLELLAAKAVELIEREHIALLVVAHDALGGGEPEILPVLDDAADVAGGDVEMDGGERVVSLIVEAESALGGCPETVGGGDADAADLIARERERVASLMTVVLPRLRSPLVTPHATALSGEPEVAVTVFVDVERQGTERLHRLELRGSGIEHIHATHGAGPEGALRIAEERIAAEVGEPMLAIEVGGLPRGDVHAEDAVGIGAYPQVVAFDAEGMGIEAGERRATGEVDERIAMTTLIAGESAIVGGYPDVSAGILAETADHIALQPPPALAALE